MDIDNHSLINQSSSNTENGRKEISFGENRKGSEPSSSSVSTNTSQTFMEEERENAIDDVSEANLHLTEHQSRSQTRNNKLSDPLCVHNCNDRLPPLETEQQFRTAVTRCARGGDSMERNSSHVDTGVARDVPNISPLMLKTKPVIISSSPVMKTSSSTKAKGVEGRRTATEVDAFFTRLSTPKCIKGSLTFFRLSSIKYLQFVNIVWSCNKLFLLLGKVSKEKKIGDRVQQVSVAQRRRYEATKGLSVNVVRTRSNSAVRSGSHCSGVGK
ncbi:hypothetical protein LOAG_17701 [Loa loa]|uniref:Uncharacterized protein n=1 Tax=Loa loa TaxID=7209 RepID=A0A1S0UHC9_LOALO|nr:hypothetical protein LOAG_17701 [Loa loa]EJD75090.1 hypothetical protein LOAG_17701 [Loa loa]